MVESKTIEFESGKKLEVTEDGEVTELRDKYDQFFDELEARNITVERSRKTSGFIVAKGEDLIDYGTNKLEDSATAAGVEVQELWGSYGQEGDDTDLHMYVSLR